MDATVSTLNIAKLPAFWKTNPYNVKLTIGSNDIVLWGCSIPTERKHYEELKERGITDIFCLMDSREYYKEFFTTFAQEISHSLGITIHQFPIKEFHIPTMDQVKTIWNIVKDVSTKGGNVAVHCSMGLGRTVIILASIMILNGTPMNDAIRQLSMVNPRSAFNLTQEFFLIDLSQDVTLC